MLPTEILTWNGFIDEVTDFLSKEKSENTKKKCLHIFATFAKTWNAGYHSSRVLQLAPRGTLSQKQIKHFTRNFKGLIKYTKDTSFLSVLHVISVMKFAQTRFFHTK